MKTLRRDCQDDADWLLNQWNLWKALRHRPGKQDGQLAQLVSTRLFEIDTV